MFVLCALSSATASIAQDTGVTARKQKQPKATPGKDPNTFVLVGAGDIAWCGNLTGAEATAKLIDKIPGTAPQDPNGQADPQNGIRQITVRTGGKSHTFLGFAQPNSEVRNADTFGALKLTLSPGKYKWEFVPEAGDTFQDSGQGTCHNAAGLSR